MTPIRKMCCPQCKAGTFYIKHKTTGERLNVYVSRDLEIIPKEEGADLSDYDTSEVWCLCCSWHGSVKRLVKW